MQRFSLEQLDEARALARVELWRRGDLRFLLDETQKELHQAFTNSPTSTFVGEIARQVGKSFSACELCCEAAIANPGQRINYITKTYRSAQDIVNPSMRIVVADAPPELCPEYKAAEQRWVFPQHGPARGAFIQLVGADEERGVARARGTGVILTVLDEAGFLDVLKLLLDDVIGPQLIRSKGKGRVLIISSPSDDPDHHFNKVADAAQAMGAYLNRDFWSPGLVPRDEKEAHVAREAASRNMSVVDFMATPYFQREYLAKRVLDPTRAVCPEFPLVRGEIVRDFEREPYFDLYISADLGLLKHQTAVLFAVSAFRAAKLRVEHELVLSGANTRTTAERIGNVLETHYRDVKPYSFVLDDPGGRVVADFWEYHRISCASVTNKDREADDNHMRLMVGGKRVDISPGCKVLIHQLATGMRNPRTGDLQEGDGHHLDAIASCRYLLRSWEPTRNPYPLDWDFDPGRQARREPPPQTTLADIFRRRT